MLFDNPRMSNLSLTPFKLNYYLSQSKKKNKSSNIFQQNYSPTNRNQSSHFSNRENQRQYAPNNQMNIRHQNQSYCALEMSPIMNNQSSISVNAYNPQQNLNDSLDVLMTDRHSHKQRYQPASAVAPELKPKFIQSPSYLKKFTHNIDESSLYEDNSFTRVGHGYMNNDSCISDLGPRHILSPRNNIQSYSKPKGSREKKKRKVNWSPSEDPQRITIYDRNIDKSFKEISHELSKITYQLNNNSKKLEQISKLHHHPIKKVNAQESLKRANLKYAVHSKENQNEKGFRSRPVVDYQDAQYKDPRNLMWQPLHQQKIIYL